MVLPRADVPAGLFAVVGKPAICVVLQAASGAPARATKKARREIMDT